MKSLIAATLLGVLALPLSPAFAETGGCLRYGVGGAVVGHYAGDHTMGGAVIGCAIGAWKRREARRAERAEQGDYQQGKRDRAGDNLSNDE